MILFDNVTVYYFNLALPTSYYLKLGNTPLYNFNYLKNAYLIYFILLVHVRERFKDCVQSD